MGMRSRAVIVFFFSWGKIRRRRVGEEGIFGLILGEGILRMLVNLPEPELQILFIPVP